MTAKQKWIVNTHNPKERLYTRILFTTKNKLFSSFKYSMEMLYINYYKYIRGKNLVNSQYGISAQITMLGLDIKNLLK